MNKPIIFMHFGNSWYLKDTLKCVKMFNPKTDICLLGDEENKYISKNLNIKFYYYKNYGQGEEFKNLLLNYKHIGSAPKWAYPKHHFNILRWFRLLDFLKKERLESCWYFDSDTLVCRNLSEIENRYYLPYYIINKISGCVTLINDIGFLKYLCNIISFYDKNEDFINYHKNVIKEKKKIGKLYNICDMSYLNQFRNIHSNFIGDLSELSITIKNDREIFDWNINSSVADQIENYPYQFQMENGKKKIFYEDGIPYFYRTDEHKCYNKNPCQCNYVRANTLNMSWVKQDFFFNVLKNLGIKDE